MSHSSSYLTNIISAGLNICPFLFVVQRKYVMNPMFDRQMQHPLYVVFFFAPSTMGMNEITLNRDKIFTNN